MMIRSSCKLCPVLLLTLVGVAPALGGDLFDNTTGVLSKKFYDKEFRRDHLPALIEKYAEAAAEATMLAEERVIVHQLLSEIPASHLGLLSTREYRILLAELQGKPTTMFGFQIAELEEGFFVHDLLAGGPAAKSGLKRGDRIVRLGGIEPQFNPRLDWRSDDAALPDPPIHRVRGEMGKTVRVEIERTPGEFLVIPLTATRYSALKAARASAEIFERDGHRIGYMRMWFIHFDELDRLLRNLLRRTFRGVDAVIIDLRGRGGSAEMVGRLVKILNDWHIARDRPIIALTDSNTRSAKELIAHALRTHEIATLVGETTAGAVLPAVFEPVGERTVLMYPAFTLGELSELLEGVGVEPHVFAEAAGPYSAGADPILEAGVVEALRQLESSVRVAPALTP